VLFCLNLANWNQLAPKQEREKEELASSRGKGRAKEASTAHDRLSANQAAHEGKQVQTIKEGSCGVILAGDFGAWGEIRPELWVPIMLFAPPTLPCAI